VSELHEMYEPGDRIHTVNSMGQLYVWTVGTDGFLTLMQYPADARVDIPTYPPQERP
jgi:hypothetical protein